MRVIAFALFLLFVVEPAYSWLALGRFLVKPVARVLAVPLYRAWVSAGRPAWNFIKSPAVMRGATIGLGVIAVGDIIRRFRELENEATRLGLQEGGLYRFYCYKVSVDTSCWNFSGCGGGSCYGAMERTCGQNGTYRVFYQLKVARYRYSGGMLHLFDGYLNVGTPDSCPYGCFFTGLDQYGVCPDSPPSSFPVNAIPFLHPPIDDSTGQTVERVVDTERVEQLITERIGNEVRKDKEVFVFPSIPALSEKIAQELPNITQEEAQQGLEGVRDESQAPDVPEVGSDVGVVDVIGVIDTGSGSGSGSGSEDVFTPIPGGFDASLPNVERLPFPLQLVQSLAQNHPLVRLIRGVNVSCSGSCSVPISVSGQFLSLNTSLDFCPYESVLSFVGSVLLAFVPLTWLFARRE